jgi:hypothetical protein
LFTTTKPFLGRSLAALAVCAVLSTTIMAVAGATPRKVERVISAELSDRVESSVTSLRARTAAPDWIQLERENPQGAKALVNLIDGIEAQLRQIAPVGTTFFVALLLLESIAALGLAWSLHHRLSRARVGPPLAPLREFRFEDQLIWGAIAGLVMVLLPKLAAIKTVGLNLLVFVGALYGLRGLGVMTWFLVAPGRWLGLAAIVLCTIMPLFWSIPISLGIGDTYWDWRRRPRPKDADGAGTVSH